MAWVAAAISLLLVIWGLRNPRYLVSLLIIAFPLEISRTWYPHIAGLDQLGEFLGAIDLGRIFTLTLLAYFLASKLRRNRSSAPWDSSEWYGERPPVWNSSLFIILGLYILIGGISFFWSVNPSKTLVETIRLAVLWLMGVAVYDIITKNRDIWLVPRTFSLMASVLAVLGVYEFVAKQYVWMGDVYLPLGRVNATFVDPNIYARFLIIGILATLALFMLTSNRVKQAFGIMALLVQAAALLATGSRTGWLTVVIVLVMLVILAPRKTVFIVLAGGLTAAAAAVIANPALAGRLVDLQQGIWIASPQREYLIKSGWDMFVNHPLTGVGLGGFQKMMLTDYSQLVQNGVSLSHTAVITTAAELGILGLGVTALFLILVYSFLPRARKMYRDAVLNPESGAIGLLTIFAVLSVTVILISAQAEGRFFEDTYLWIMLGYLAVLRNMERVD